MGKLSTHVLDTATGRPAAKLKIELWSVGPQTSHVKTLITNDDGRTDSPVLAESEMAVGSYELRFHAGDYLRRSGAKLDEPAFLDVIPIRFGISSAVQHYHVPLLLCPYGYSTYRGS